MFILSVEVGSSKQSSGCGGLGHVFLTACSGFNLLSTPFLLHRTMSILGAESDRVKDFLVRRSTGADGNQTLK
jgi:hypothetical protein